MTDGFKSPLALLSMFALGAAVAIGIVLLAFAGGIPSKEALEAADEELVTSADPPPLEAVGISAVLAIFVTFALELRGRVRRIHEIEEPEDGADGDRSEDG